MKTKCEGTLTSRVGPGWWGENVEETLPAEKSESFGVDRWGFEKSKQA